MNFNLGNAIKYIWRCYEKGGVEDLRKALWYLDDEVRRIENAAPSSDPLQTGSSVKRSTYPNWEETDTSGVPRVRQDS